MGYETLVNSEECRFLNDEEKGLTRKILVNFYCENRKEIEDFLNKTKFPIRRIVKPEEFDEAKEIFEKYHDYVNKYELYGVYISIMLGKEKIDEEEKKEIKTKLPSLFFWVFLGSFLGGLLSSLVINLIFIN